MEEELMFNFEDMNVTEEALNILSGETPPEEEREETVETPEPPAAEIPETTGEETAEEEEEENEHSSEDTPSSEADSSQSTLYALAKYLKDEGVLFLDEELKDVETIEDLKTLIAESHNKARFNNMSDSQRRYYEALENGIPVKEYETVERDIQTFSNIEEEKIDTDAQLQYELIAIDFMNQGLPQEKAMKLAELSVKAEGEDSVAEAKAALQNIIAHKTEQYKELLASTKEKTELDLKTIKEAIDGKQELLTMKLNDNTKTQLFDLMTTKVGTDDNGLPLNKLQKYQRDNPVEANILMNYLFMMTNEGKDLGLIKTNTTSVASKELEKKLKQLNFDQRGALIIPDNLVSSNRKTNNSQKENLTINI